MSKFVIIDYHLANLASIKNAMEYLKCDVTISNSIEDIKKADALILPGVGAFGKAMTNLKKLKLIDTLNKAVLIEKKPILGICLGFQLFAKSSSEMGLHKGLSWINSDVRKLKVSKKLRLPHIGWNEIAEPNNSALNDSVLLKDIPDNNFYFVHTYAILEKPKGCSVSICNYGNDFIATISKDNIMGTQFHPEKSHASGLKILKNFILFTKNYYA